MKKILALLLVLVMALGCLAACAPKDPKPTNPPATNPPATGDSADNTTAAPTLMPVEDMPVVECVFAGPAHDDDEMVEEAMNKLLEKYEVQIDMTFIDFGEYTQKVGLMVNAEETFELMFTCGWCNPFLTLVEQGGLYPLDDLLESEAGKLLKEAVPEYMLLTGKDNTPSSDTYGQTFAIPNQQKQYYQIGYCFLKELCDKYNFDPYTIQEDIHNLDTFLAAVKEGEPDIIPYSSIQGWGNVIYDMPDARVSLTQGYVAYPDDITNIVHPNGENPVSVEDPFIPEEFQNYWKFLNNGWIRADTATLTDADEGADINAGKVACWKRFYSAAEGPNQAAMVGKEVIMVPVGVAEKDFLPGGDTMLGINASADEPEAAIKLWGILWTDVEVYNTLIYGVEGVHYNKTGEDRVELIGDGYAGRNAQAWAYADSFNAWKTPSQADDIYDIERKNNAEAFSNGYYFNFHFDNSAVEVEVANVAAVDAEYSKQYQYREDLEAWMAEWNQKKLDAGWQKISDEFMKQINAYIEANPVD